MITQDYGNSSGQGWQNSKVQVQNHSLLPFNMFVNYFPNKTSNKYTCLQIFYYRYYSTKLYA